LNQSGSGIVSDDLATSHWAKKSVEFHEELSTCQHLRQAVNTGIVVSNECKISGHHSSAVEQKVSSRMLHCNIE